jgi:hypothetical protein
MTTDERSSHFHGFAKLLIDEMDTQVALWLEPSMEEQLLSLVASRAYDLVQHALACGVEAVEEVPDLTVFDDAQYHKRLREKH